MPNENFTPVFSTKWRLKRIFLRSLTYLVFLAVWREALLAIWQFDLLMLSHWTYLRSSFTDWLAGRSQAVDGWFLFVLCVGIVFAWKAIRWIFRPHPLDHPINPCGNSGLAPAAPPPKPPAPMLPALKNASSNNSGRQNEQRPTKGSHQDASLPRFGLRTDKDDADDNDTQQTGPTTLRKKHTPSMVNPFDTPTRRPKKKKKQKKKRSSGIEM